MHDDRSLIETRLAQALEDRIRPCVHPRSVPLDVQAWSAPGEPVPVAEGLAAQYEPVEVGRAWGRPWATVWFRIRGTVPDDWAGSAVEAVLDLGFTGAGPGFQAEALVYRPDATAIKSLNPRTRWVRIADKAGGGEEVLLYLEASSNPEIDGHDSTYGHDVTRSRRDEAADDGGTTTTVRLSLLRAPTFPDPHPDQGVHRLGYALVPGAAIGDAVREGYRINLPEREIPGDTPVAPLVAVDHDGVVIEAVKLADDGSGDVLVRLYEAHGGRAQALLTPGFPAAGAVETDLLERPWRDARPRPALTAVRDDGAVELDLRPFQIVTLRLARA